MTHQTNEELREKINKRIAFENKLAEENEVDLLEGEDDTAIVIDTLKWVLKEMSLIPQPEQLEVEIIKKYEHTYDVRLARQACCSSCKDTFYWNVSKQQALDFCKRFNLKVVEV